MTSCPGIPKSEFEFALIDETSVKRYFLSIIDTYINHYTYKVLYRVRIDDEYGNIRFETYNHDSLKMLWSKRTEDTDDLPGEAEETEPSV